MANGTKVPATDAEAVAQGFKPIEDFAAFIKEHTGLSLQQYEAHRHRAYALSLPLVDCSSQANRGKVCQHDTLVDGTVWVCTCQGDGSCGGCKYK